MRRLSAGGSAGMARRDLGRPRERRAEPTRGSAILDSAPAARAGNPAAGGDRRCDARVRRRGSGLRLTREPRLGHVRSDAEIAPSRHFSAAPARPDGAMPARSSDKIVRGGICVIVCFGSLNADLIFRLPEVPRSGQTLLADDLAVQAGGKGANQAVAAARDGASVAMVGAVGSDALAEVALSGLREAGADTARVREVAAATGCASIWIDAQGRNRIVVALGANGHTRADQVADADLAGRRRCSCRWRSIRPRRRLCCAAPGRSACAASSTSPRPAARPRHDAARRPPRRQRGRGRGDRRAPRLRAGGRVPPPRARHRRGAHPREAGSEAATESGAWHVPARAVEPVDTTAAGDCFVGVLAAALDRGTPLRAAMERASVAAALACGRRGSQASLPWREETDRALGT